MQVIHIIYKMEVEITENLPFKPYTFEGEPSLQNVPFNYPQTLKIYELITSAKAKEEISYIHKSVFEVFPQLLALSVGESIAKSVCAKIVSRGETIVQCLNCRMDESCIICLNCFKNGNHEGHKVLYKKAYGGCCDCGDAEAWNPKGFCKQHSGEVQDIHIYPGEVSTFCSIMQELFYLYFRLKLRKENQNIQNVALISLVNVCQLIIEKGPKGIKLLALFFQSRISLTIKYNEQLQKQYVVAHMFIWRLLGRDLKFWEPVLINMFPYYQFKKILLSTYIEYFPQLYVNEESCMAGQSLACQILTSYKLVEDYIDSPHSQPIGYNIKGIMDPQHMHYLSSILCSDLQKIIRLQDPVPEKYIRFQSQKGVSNLFPFQDIVISQTKKYKKLAQNSNKHPQEDTKSKKKKKKKIEACEEQTKKAFFNPILYMIRNIKQIFNQYTSLQMLSAQLHVISRDRLSLIKMLKDLGRLIQTTPEELVIFRAYDRAFALTLFTLCGYNLDKLLEFQFRRELMEVLEKDEQGFQAWLKMVEQRMLSTYFFYCHVLCNEDRGYHSSFFNYIYLYRSKDNFLISIDTLQLKMMALLSRTKTVLDFRKLLRFQDLDEEKWSCFILNTLLQELPLLYIGNFSQIYTSHYQITAKDKMEVRKDVIGYLSKFIVGQGNSTTLQRATQFSRAFLFDNLQLLKKCLLQCCNYIKEKKIFQLRPQFRQEKPFNYKDFELKLKDDKFSNKNADQARPQLTYPLINGYNRVVFSHFWNDQNIESIKEVMMDLYQDVVKTEVHDNILELATIICKYCANLKTFASLEQQAFVDEILLRTAFSPDIKQKLTQFKGLIGEDEQVPTDVKLKEKKELLLMKKMKKMEELKKKQEENMSTIRQVHKIQEQIHEAGQFCAICRNKDNNKNQLVYLVNLNIRNIQKLAKLGSGVQTVSFTTCYHIFDYNCLEKECKHLFDANLKCPVCRKAGNIFLPAYPLWDQEGSSPYVVACIERVTQIMMTIHSYMQLNPVEQLFKSFYHFALLSLFDPEYVRKSRLKLYRVILQMLSHRAVQKEVPELVQKLNNNDFNLNPKLLRKEKVSIINVKAGGEDFFEGISDESDSQDESLIMVQHKSKKIKQKEKPQAKKKGKITELSPIFRFLALRLLKNVFQVEKKESEEKLQQMKKEKPQENMNEQIKQRQASPFKDNTRQMLNSQVQPEVPKEIQLIINELIGAHKVAELPPSKPLELQLVKLPQNFDWNMNKIDCDLCKQPCHDMFSCLLCPWKGCLNCKPGGVNKHYQLAHGETSAFMRVNDGMAYIIGTKMIRKVGCLFLNEWGEPLKLKYDWNSYCLQPDVLQKIRNLLLRDE